MDLLVLGLNRASEMAGPPQMPNDFLSFQVNHHTKVFRQFFSKYNFFFLFVEKQNLNSKKIISSSHHYNSHQFVSFPKHEIIKSKI